MKTMKTDSVGIILRIHGGMSELTLDEARNLYETLHEIFGQKETTSPPYDFTKGPICNEYPNVWYTTAPITTGDPIF